MKLLLIHGAGGTKSKWRGIEPYLESIDYEAIDLPGHGQNNENKITTIGEFATYINQSIKEDTIVVGHSMGGLIAIEAASQNSHIKGIVLAASFYQIPVHQKLLDKLASGEFPQSLFFASYGSETEDALLEIEKSEISLVPVEVAHADFNATNLYVDGKEKLSQLQIPVGAILGGQDRLLPPRIEDLFKEVKNDIQVSVVEGAGHYVMLEKPEEFSKALIGFVKNVKEQL